MKLIKRLIAVIFTPTCMADSIYDEHPVDDVEFWTEYYKDNPDMANRYKFKGGFGRYIYDRANEEMIKLYRNGQILRMLTASLNSYKVDKVRRVNLTNMNAMLSGGALGSVLAYEANRYCGMEGCMLIGAGIVLIGTISGFFTYAKCKAEVQA